MTIRLAQPKDIPALLGLLEQILSVHHQARPDIFKESGGKYSEEELEQLCASSDKNPLHRGLVCRSSNAWAKNRRSTLSVCPSLCQGNRLLQPNS